MSVRSAIHTLVGIALAFGAWVLLSWWLGTAVLPSPRSVYDTLTLPGPRRSPVAKEIPSDLWITIVNMAKGSAAGFLTGIAAGVGLAQSRVARWIIRPHVSILNTLPHIAILPVLVIFFGFGSPPVVFLVWSGVVVVVALNTEVAFAALDRNLMDRLAYLNASYWQRIRYVVFPSIVPSLLGSARLTIGYAWGLAILGETFGQTSGIGHLLIWYNNEGYLPGLVLTAIVITIAAVVMEQIVAILERRLAHYERRRSGRQTETLVY